MPLLNLQTRLLLQLRLCRFLYREVALLLEQVASGDLRHHAASTFETATLSCAAATKNRGRSSE